MEDVNTRADLRDEEENSFESLEKMLIEKTQSLDLVAIDTLKLLMQQADNERLRFDAATSWIKFRKPENGSGTGSRTLPPPMDTGGTDAETIRSVTGGFSTSVPTESEGD